MSLTSFASFLKSSHQKINNLYLFIVSFFCVSLAYAQEDFLNGVKNATAKDSAALKASTTSGVNNYAAILLAVFTFIGLIFFGWGIFLVMKASRSDGREKAGPGWMMMVGGGTLGILSTAFFFLVGGLKAMLS
jgi:hypothetical protein